jgi:hypothetical protein
VDIFSNPELLKNIRKTSKFVRIRCNAGITTTNLIGYLPGYGKVWYNPKGYANILSLSNVGKNSKIIYDSSKNDGFKIYKIYGKILQFKKNNKGLYIMDMDDPEVCMMQSEVDCYDFDDSEDDEIDKDCWCRSYCIIEHCGMEC